MDMSLSKPLALMMDTEAQRPAVYGVAQSRIQLKLLNSSSSSRSYSIFLPLIYLMSEVDSLWYIDI